MQTYTQRLLVEDTSGHSWTAVQEARAGLTAAAAWREDTRIWCARNPLPAGYTYRIPLPTTRLLPPAAPSPRPDRRRRRRTA